MNKITWLVVVQAIYLTGFIGIVSVMLVFAKKANPMRLWRNLVVDLALVLCVLVFDGIMNRFIFILKNPNMSFWNWFYENVIFRNGTLTLFIFARLMLLFVPITHLCLMRKFVKTPKLPTNS